MLRILFIVYGLQANILTAHCQSSVSEIDSLLTEIEQRFQLIYNCDSLERIGRDSLYRAYCNSDPFRQPRMMLVSDTMWNRSFEYNYMHDMYYLNGQFAEWRHQMEHLLYDENLPHFKNRLEKLITVSELDCYELFHFNTGLNRLRHPPRNILFALYDMMKDVLHSSDYIGMDEIEIFRKLHKQGWDHNRNRYGFINRHFEMRLLSGIITEIPDELILAAICASEKTEKQIYFNAYCHKKTTSEIENFVIQLKERGIKTYSRGELFTAASRDESSILDPTR